MTERPSPPQPPSRLELLLLAALALAVLASGLLALSTARPATDRDDILTAARGQYRGLWQEIDRHARVASQRVGQSELTSAEPLELFERVEEALPPPSDRSWALFLIDPAGRLQAWAGAGLLHQLDPVTLPSEGRAYRASLTAVTALSVAAVEAFPGWRTVAGLSLPSSHLPFTLPGRAHLQTQWALAPERGVVPPGRAVVELDSGPRLVIDEASLASTPPQETPWWRHPLTWMGALILLSATVFRRALGWFAPPVVAVALAIWAAVAGASPVMTALLAATGLSALASLGLALGRARVRAPVWIGAGGSLVLGAAAAGLHAAGPVDLAEHFVAGGPASVARTLLFLLAVTWLGLLVRGVPGHQPEGRTRPLWFAAAALALAATLVDHPGWAIPIFALAGATLGLGLAGRSVRRRPLTFAALAVLAAVAAATASEVAHRAALRHELGSATLAALAPPSRAETNVLREGLRQHFAEFDLSDLTAGDILDLEPSDLAFEVWRRSPLARGRAVSAVALRGIGGQEFLFSFGIPLGSNGRPRVQSRERPFDNPVWDFALLNETAPVTLMSEPWGELEYWLLVRPGFRQAEERLSDVAGDLLRGGPSGRGAVQQQVAPAAFAHYATRRLARISPWIEAPELPEALMDGGRGRVSSPEGLAWVWTASEPEGTRALFLARLSPLAALERVGIQAAGSLWPAALLLALTLLLRLARPTFRRRLWELWHSYARRLIIVFSLLVLVPAVIVDVLVLRVLRERAEREQLRDARAALVAAQRVLGEYSVSLDTGVSLNTAIDDDLLSWLASVLDHDVNLYWASSSELLASSRRELFAAGLLPRRVPGEVHADLELRGKRLASRLHQSGATVYTELYAPLTAPDEPLEDAAYFLSLPLLTQQEQVAEELEALRHKVVLATSLLVLLLVALGARLASSFTAPLEELVEGTQRIAAGAERLDLEPRELELATLVRAIDRMAERVADGRRKLLLEKRVVERMVDNITAAVVSIDADHRVLMQNKVAVDLLGTQVGLPIETSLGETPNLGMVLEGLRRSEESGAPETVSLSTQGEDEPRQWSLVWVPIPGEGEPSALVVVEDVTEVVRGQRLQAWAEMARIIAHEIKNPLTPIRLSAEHLREVREREPESFDRVFDQCISNILSHVDELRTISTEFSTYSRLPRIEPVEGNLTQSMRTLVEGYQVALPRGIEVSFRARGGDVVTRFDDKLLGRAVRNLLENALRAVDAGGSVEVTVGSSESGHVIQVSDDGPGVAAEQLSKIFDPYFSTHDTGTGLGLPIARRIIEEHGGEIHARNRVGGGLTVSVEFPPDSRG